MRTTKLFMSVLNNQRTMLTNLPHHKGHDGECNRNDTENIGWIKRWIHKPTIVHKTCIAKKFNTPEQSKIAHKRKEGILNLYKKQCFTR